VSAEQLAKTKVAVEEFRAGAGPKAQLALKDDDEHHLGTSYISAMWYDMYLRNRDPAPLNLTPQLSWKEDENPAKNEQAVRAADICHAAGRFYASLQAGVLVPDVFHTKPGVTKHAAFESLIAALPTSVSYYPAVAAGAYALDMSQYERLFCSTRLPRAGKDELVTAEHCPYVVAIRGADMFKVSLFQDDDGDIDGTHLAIHSPEAIEAQIRAVLASKPSGNPPVAALTETERDAWAATRAHMESDPVNRVSLADVDRALFVLSLDDETPATHEELSRSMLHGYARDRWFDKSFNIIVTKNGEPPAAQPARPPRSRLPTQPPSSRP